MNIYFLIYFLCGSMYFATSLITLVKYNRKVINLLFFIICLNLSTWSLVLAMMVLAKDAEGAVFYRRLLVVQWSTLYVEILFFIILLTNNEKYIDKLWKKILVTLPGVLSFIIYFFTPFSTENVQQINNGWAYLIPTDRGFVWNNFFNIYYLSYMLIALILVHRWIRTTQFERERKQGKIIFRSFIYILVASSSIDILLPSLGIGLLPPVIVVISTIAIGSMAYAITVYQMISITPEGIMMDVYKNMNEGIIITDKDDTIISLNEGAQKILSCISYEKLGLDIKVLLKSGINQPLIYEENFTGKELNYTVNENLTLSLLVSAFSQYDQFEGRVGSVYTFQDISYIKKVQSELEDARLNLEEKIQLRTNELRSSNDQLYNEILRRIENESEIKKLAFSDQLTGLPNRRQFYKSLNNEIKDCKINNQKCAVLFMDLDGFKMINDTLGHDKGDELLVSVSKRVRHILKDEDLLCRVGGDEFLILISNINNTHTIEKICNKVIFSLQSPFVLGNNRVHVKSSIGIACYPEDGRHSDELVKHADIAMYKAKENGKNQFIFFNNAMKEGIEEAMYLSNELYKAFDNKEFVLEYQPQVDAISNEITGFEALLRWDNPDRGRISPTVFIPLAERTGLILPIGEWVIYTAAMQQVRWKNEYGSDLTMSVNLSMKQIKEEQLESSIAKTIIETGINPSKLEFEITESIFMDDTKLIISKLNKIKALGIMISIDDFGTEYSSLNYLKLMPIDRIKIPKPFIDGISVYPKDEAIITSLIVLAQKMSCKIVAEGVEEKHQYDFLKESACDDIQGFYFYKSLSPEDIYKQKILGPRKFLKV